MVQIKIKFHAAVSKHEEVHKSTENGTWEL